MARKTPLDKLSTTISKILSEYGDEIVKDTGELAKKFAQKGAQTLQQESKGHDWGDTTDYDSGWTSRYETGRLSQQGIIYNAKVPGLPHLLENGHALRGGGRATASAFPHIAPVEEMISEEFYKAVKQTI